MKKYKPYFINEIGKKYPDNAAAILVEAEIHYSEIAKDTRFSFKSKNPIDRRLDFTAYFLALIKTMHGRGEPYEKIRQTCLDIVLEYVRPKNKFQARMKKIPVMLIKTWIFRPLIKALSKKVGQNENEEGFIAKIITDKSETFGLGYGVDILECGICKLFKKHGYEQYASILCEVDKVTSGLAGLELIRNGTIALGAKKCDFRFKKIE